MAELQQNNSGFPIGNLFTVSLVLGLVWVFFSFGGGFVLLFADLPWYLWAFAIVAFIGFLFRK